MADAALQLPATTETTTELVVIKSTPAKLNLNIKQLTENVRKMLEPYKVVVTVDTVQGAKDLMKELNVKATSIKDVFKSAASEATADIDEKAEQVTALVNEILDARTDLKAQVDKFEAERKALALEKLQAKQKEMWEAEGVQEEFQRSDVSKLATLSALTKTGFSAPTMTKLKDLIAGDKNLQTQTEHRLLMLENESFKAGLKAVLTRDHVEAFLFADQDTYQQRLSAMLESECKRQDATEAAARQQFEQEQARQQEAQQREQEQQQESQAKQAPVEQAPAKPQTIEEQVEALESQIQRARTSAQYCETRKDYRESMEYVSKLESQLKQLKTAQQEPVEPQQKSQEEAYMLCAIHDTAKPLTQPFQTCNPSEAIQAALSESANRSEQSAPFYVAIWTKSAGRVAIVDGLSGEVYQRVSA